MSTIITPGPYQCIVCYTDMGIALDDPNRICEVCRKKIGKAKHVVDRKTKGGKKKYGGSHVINIGEIEIM